MSTEEEEDKTVYYDLRPIDRPIPPLMSFKKRVMDSLFQN